MSNTLGRLIQFKQGERISLPQLKIGEPGFCEDDNTFWIGGVGGNQQYVKQEEVDILKSGLSVLGNDYNEFKDSIVNLPPTYLLPPPNGFSNDTTIRYEKDATSEVILYMFLSKNSDFVSGQTLLIGALPEGFRPSHSHTITTLLYSNTGVLIPNSHTSILLTPNGEVRLTPMNGGNFVNARRVYGVSLNFRARN